MDYHDDQVLIEYNVSTQIEKTLSTFASYWNGGNTTINKKLTDVETMEYNPTCYWTYYYDTSPAIGYARSSVFGKGSETCFTINSNNEPSVSSFKTNIEISAQDNKKIYLSTIGGFNNTSITPDATKAYMLKSTDDGATWKSIQTDFTLVSLNQNDDKLLLGIKDNKLVIKTSDTSLTSQVVDSTVKWTDYLAKFYYSSDKKHIFTTVDQNDTCNLMVSEDNGFSWHCMLTKPRKILLCLDKSKSNLLYFSVKNSIYLSTDYGKTISVYQTMPDSIVGLYKKPNTDTLFVLTSMYLYKVTANSITTINGVATDVKKQETATTFMLQQNYPNPFNPATKIEYKVSKSGLVLLSVYNSLGQEVSRLVNETKQPGNYSVEFNGKNMPSGIYYYRLTSGDNTVVKKMCLLK